LGGDVSTPIKMELSENKSRTPILRLDGKERLKDYSFLEKDLANDFSELLKAVLRSNPAAAYVIYKNKSEIVKNLLKSLEVGAFLSKEERFIVSAKGGEKTDIFRPLVIGDNKIIYTRFDSLDAVGLAKAHEALYAILRYAHKPSGMILDLRHCVDDKPANAVKLLSMFKNPEQLLLSYDFKNLKPFILKIEIPLIVVIGSETRGSPEIFASLIKNYSGIVSIGEQTFGTPFPFKNIPFNNGKILNLPIIPEAMVKVLPYPVVPDISIDHIYPMVSYKVITGKVDAYSKDKAIKRALEILLCVHALTKKREKREKQ